MGRVPGYTTINALVFGIENNKINHYKEYVRLSWTQEFNQRVTSETRVTEIIKDQLLQISHRRRSKSNEVWGRQTSRCQLGITWKLLQVWLGNTWELMWSWPNSCDVRRADYAGKSSLRNSSLSFNPSMESGCVYQCHSAPSFKGSQRKVCNRSRTTWPPS